MTSWTRGPPLSSTISWSYSDSCPLSQQCYPSTSSSTTLFFYLQSFPASGYFPISRLFASGGQRIGASASILTMNIQGWFPLGLTGWISLLSKGFSRVFPSTTVWKHQFFVVQPLWFNSLICTWLQEKSQLWLDGLLLAKWGLSFLMCYLCLS